MIMPNVAIDTSTDGAEIVAAPGAGKRIHVYGFDITANGQVVVSLKSGGTTLWKTYAMNSAGVLGGYRDPD